MPRRSRVVWCVALLVVFTGCGGTSSSPAQPSAGTPSAAARSYLDELIGIMQASSINRYKIDWASFRQSVYQAAGSSDTIQAAVESGAIGVALRRLADHHSFYMKANGSYIYNPDPLGRCADPSPPAAVVPAAVGYVQVGGFGGSGSEITAFATSIQSRIQSQDGSNVTRLDRGSARERRRQHVADDRGARPVLGEGTAGAFIDPDGKVSYWGYANGASTSSGVPVVQLPQPYQLLRANPRVAVLTNCFVASSGEATAIAFRGRPDTRSFGTSTVGNSTANSSTKLSDGAWLYLTVSVMADRTLTRYGDVVAPDEVIADPAQTLQRAVDWLLQ